MTIKTRSSNTLEFLKSRREAMKSAGVKLPRRKKVPRPLYPTGIEREYYAAILKLIEPLFEEIKEGLIPRLPKITKQHEEESRVDSATARQQRMDISYAEIITRIFSNIQIGITLRMPDLTIQAQADKFARRVSTFNKAQVDRQFQSVLGLPILRTERWLEPKVTAFVERNVTLIKSIPADSLKKVEQMVRHSVEKGVATTTLEQNVIDEFTMARSRAHLIARDQISKFNGKLNELRQKEVGVTQYDWSTSKDERVRPRHAAVDGQRFSWDDPPPVGSNGERLNPGEDYQCRCVALPVLEEFTK